MLFNNTSEAIAQVAPLDDALRYRMATNLDLSFVSINSDNIVVFHTFTITLPQPVPYILDIISRGMIKYDVIEIVVYIMRSIVVIVVLVVVLLVVVVVVVVLLT